MGPFCQCITRPYWDETLLGYINHLPPLMLLCLLFANKQRLSVSSYYGNSVHHLHKITWWANLTLLVSHQNVARGHFNPHLHISAGYVFIVVVVFHSNLKIFHKLYILVPIFMHWSPG